MPPRMCQNPPAKEQPRLELCQLNAGRIPTSDLKDVFVDQEKIAAGSIEGEVISFVASKGYGFISGDDGERYFVHQKDVKGGEPLTSGQRVTFVPTPSPKGRRPGMFFQESDQP